MDPDSSNDGIVRTLLAQLGEANRKIANLGDRAVGVGCCCYTDFLSNQQCVSDLAQDQCGIVNGVWHAGETCEEIADSPSRGLAPRGPTLSEEDHQQQ